MTMQPGQHCPGKRDMRDLCGERFGRLLVVQRDAASTPRARYFCRCDCGSTKAVLAQSLRKGATTSCGYGGRGIGVVDRWLDFENFFADMGERPDGTSIDRIDVNGPYGPSNCRWATALEQANNTRCNRLVPLDGEVVTVAEMSRRLGISYEQARNRALASGHSYLRGGGNQ